MIRMNKYDRWEKQLIAMHRRLNEVDKEINDTMELIPLEHPVLRGYTYKLSVIDAPKYRDNALLCAAIDASTDAFWVLNKKDVNRSWRTIYCRNDDVPSDSRRSDNFDLADYKLQLNWLWPEDFWKLVRKSTGVEKFFMETRVKPKDYKRYYVAFEPDVVKLRGITRRVFVKHFIRSRTIIRGDLVSESAILNHQLWYNGRNCARMNKIKSYKRDRWWDCYRTIKMQKQHEFDRLARIDFDEFMAGDGAGIEYTKWRL